jgi:NAD(P)-dependent dehydrogenase (short-subunit alcohol dehydrogenase family)
VTAQVSAWWSAVGALGGLGVVNNIAYAPGPCRHRSSTPAAPTGAVSSTSLVSPPVPSAGRVMVDTGSERIINVSSVDRAPVTVHGAVGSQAAINHLTQTGQLRAAASRRAIAPGTTLTGRCMLFDAPTTYDPSRVDPLRRMVEHDELARLSIFLASDLARCITGQFVLADAGAFLSRTRPANKTPTGEPA